MLSALVSAEEYKGKDHKGERREEYHLMATTREAMVAAAQAVVPSVTVEEVQAKLRAGESVTILDVREKEEYEQGHIPQAVLLPRGLLEFRIDGVIPDRTTNIILH
jgi:3-mercaptopyruvate sulfurtransferase SseA